MDTKSLRRIFEGKDRKKLLRLAIMLAVGVALLIASMLMKNRGSSGGTSGQNQSDASQDAAQATSDESDYAGKLEARLAETLSLVNGAGRVEVMVTLAESTEIVPAKEIDTSSSSTTESDSQGGTRQSTSSSADESYVILSPAGNGQEALVIKEIAPKVEGVIIVAEGGGDITVKDALTRAAYTVLGIEAHKVQVLQMKSSN